MGNLSLWFLRTFRLLECSIRMSTRGFPWWSSGQDSMLSLSEPWVQSLVGEPRSYMPQPKKVGKSERQGCTGARWEGQTWENLSFQLCRLWPFSLVQSLSRVRLFATPRTAARQPSLSIANSQKSVAFSVALGWSFNLAGMEVFAPRKLANTVHRGCLQPLSSPSTWPIVSGD